MTAVVEICSAKGEVSRSVLCTEKVRSGSSILLPFTLCEEGRSAELTVRVCKAESSVYVFSLVSSEKIALSYVRVIFSLPGEGRVLYYDAASCTNAFVRICEYRYDEETEPRFLSRDIFMAQDEKAGRLNIAFATFRRFYTRFRLEHGSVIAEYELENKVINDGEEYELEHLLIDGETEALSFFERYTCILAKTHDIRPLKYIPKGWSSWSCYYGGIDEEKLLRQAALVKKQLSQYGADLIQLDDGWQKEGSFGCCWTTDFDKFPSGIESVSKKIKDMGLSFGIWIAPGLVRDTSPVFEEKRHLLVKEPDGTELKCFGGSDSLSDEKDGSIFAFDIGNAKVLEMTREIFRRAKEEYGASYFKIDFIINLLYRVAFGTPVTYPGDYSVALYRQWISLIRKTVGEDAFLLSCGAPIGESVGIFDSVRISPDISWGGAGRNGAPKPFEIIRNDVQNIILRSPYHGRVFINDSDALLARDYLTEYCDDALVLNDNEARLWATAVLMSGGHILLNEEIDRLPEKRLALVKRTYELSNELAPATGFAAARPKNFFEFPYCTESYLEISEEYGGGYVCALFNWDDEMREKEFSPDFYFGTETSACGGNAEYSVYDVWSGECLFDKIKGAVSFSLAPHSCVCIKVLLKRVI